MHAYPILWDWLSFALRWLHVIVGIAWIGSSFYFIALDLGLRRERPLPDGVKGEEWQVHGGGFYHIQKYTVAPDALPERLIWFKWESYATWLSGFALMVVIYYFGADLYLIDPNKLDVTPLQAAGLSMASLALGWLAYDGLCKSALGRDPTRLMLVLYVILVALGWAYTQVFTGRAALLHLGALTATIMSANVFFIIIPNQKIVVADLKAGRTPDPKYGVIAKQRSTHNNYLTLPVLFLMLSNHYPLAFATEWNWVIAALVFLMGVTIRHYFNTLHATGHGPLWTWGATAAAFMAVVWLSSLPRGAEADLATVSPLEERLAASPAFEEVHSAMLTRCAMCHAQEPLWPGMATAPKAVHLESEADVLAHARAIYLHSGRSYAMPPANLTAMEAAERQAIVAWYEEALAGE
ncbi:MAG: urate hydroxylase PuuD [Pseudomonadota bacterium]